MVKKFFVELGRTIVRTVIFIYCKIVYRVKIVGTQNVPKEGALLFCGNHRTYLDPPLIVVTAGRHMRFMAKEELRKNPLFAFLGVLFEGIYVKRDEKDITALKEALKTLKNGGCIGIFPEGTRNGLEKNDGKIKNGAAYMALKTNAKIVPVGIIGPAKPFSKNAIIYGEPIDLSEYITGKKIEKETEDKVSEIIKDKIVELSSKEI
ncbi:MAG TPA: 1-acyl-sn-glycerol-3-phosphate acyltransferase [Candidatus Scatovivens faecipullorum]|nr:1-acyl-sn-glycerol-3-phosphate acyltransferase [Candidatus Scatovivens faecipullorum]